MTDTTRRQRVRHIIEREYPYHGISDRLLTALMSVVPPQQPRVPFERFIAACAVLPYRLDE